MSAQADILPADRAAGWGLEFSLLIFLVATSTVYLPLMHVEGLAIRAFEAALVLWILLFLPRLRVPVDFMTTGLISLLCMIAMTFVVHGIDSDGLALAFKLGTALLLYIAVRNCAAMSHDAFRKTATVWALSATTVVAVGVAAWAATLIGVAWGPELLFQSSGGPRVQSLLPDPNRFGNLSALVFSGSILWGVTQRRIRLFTLLIFSVSASGVILSGSRGALLSSLIGAAATLVLAAVAFRQSEGVNVGLRILVGAFGIALVGGTVVALSDDLLVVARLLGDEQERDQILTNIRWEYAATAFETIRERPVFLLFGMGQYSRIAAEFGGSFSLHNTYLLVLSAVGAAGLAIYLLMLALPLLAGVLSVLRVASEEPADPSRCVPILALMAGYVTLLIHLNTIVLFTTGYVWVFIGLFVAAVDTARQKAIYT